MTIMRMSHSVPVESMERSGEHVRMFEFRQPDSVAPSSLFARFTQRHSLPLVPSVDYTAKNLSCSPHQPARASRWLLRDLQETGRWRVQAAVAVTSSTIHTPEPASIPLQRQSIQFSGSVARSARSRAEAVRTSEMNSVAVESRRTMDFPWQRMPEWLDGSLRIALVARCLMNQQPLTPTCSLCRSVMKLGGGI